MRQILMTVFFVLIAGFSIVGYAQTVTDENEVVEEQQEEEHGHDRIVNVN